MGKQLSQSHIAGEWWSYRGLLWEGALDTCWVNHRFNSRT